MATAVFPDNTVLCNFAAIRRLDILEGWLRGRGCWTEAVANEVGRSAQVLPDLALVAAAGWLGQPVEIVGEADAQRVEHIRRDIFGGPPSEPRRHLGEAQTCYLLKEAPEWREAWWVTDDREALHFARRQGITSRDTFDVIAGVVADGDLTTQAAYDLMYEMDAADRILRLPATAADLLV